MAIFLAIIVFCTKLSLSEPRPWEIQPSNTPYTGTFVPQLVQELDSWAATLLSQSQVPLVGAGAALAYLAYAGAIVLTGQEVKSGLIRGRSVASNETDDLLSQITSGLVVETLSRTESAAAFRRTGARALHHGAAVLRRGLKAFARVVGFVFSGLSYSQRALHTDCVSKQLCRIGQMTGMRWPMLGMFLRNLDSADLDEYSRAIIDGTTVGDCTAIFHKCPE